MLDLSFEKLKKDIFANSKVIFKDRVVKRIEYKAYTDRYEMNVQDVCKLFLNEEQKKELRRAMSVVTDKYKFVQEDIVKRKGTDVANNKLSADIMDDAYDMIKLLTNNNTGKY